MQSVFSGFRNFLAELNGVLRGLTTLREQLVNWKNPAAGTLAEQLAALDESISLQQEAIWPFEATDVGLFGLLDKLGHAALEPEEMVTATNYVDRLRVLLSMLSRMVEQSLLRPNRNEMMTKVAPKAKAEARQLNRKLLAYELVNGRRYLQSAPLRHVLHTTTRCNLRCLTCFQSASQDFVHHDLADTSREALQPALPLAQQVMVAGTGEPLLSRSAGALIAEYKEAGVDVEVITNGTTLGLQPNLISAIDVLLLSFDGGTAMSYNAIRRHGNFETLVAKIAGLPVEQRKKIRLNFVVTRQNIYTARDCVRLAMRLQLGCVYFQEMTAYLPWHDRMLISDLERRWFFQHFPDWAASAEGEGVEVVCHLVQPSSADFVPTEEVAGSTINSIAAVADVPMAPAPARISLQEIQHALEALVLIEVPLILRLLARVTRDPPREHLPLAGNKIEPPEALAKEQATLAFLMHHRLAKLPHCLSTYAHILINEDGTTRSCCKVQSRLASITKLSFDEIRNSPSNVILRAGHAAGVAPRKECVGCRDPLRFHFLPQLLEELKADGVDLRKIGKPKDFPIPASLAGHPLVQELGSCV